MISLQEARARLVTVDVYKELRLSDRTDYLDLPDGAITVQYRIVAGTNMDEDLAGALQLVAAGIVNRTPEADETPDEMAARLAAELSARKAAQFVATVAAWDFSAAPGEPPIALDEKTIRQQVPNEIVGDVLNAVAHHRVPGKNGKRR